MRLITANVRYTMRPRRAARAIRQVADEAGPHGVVLWQECHRVGHRKALRELPGDWRTYMPVVNGKPTGAPISWRTDTWKMHATGWAKLHDAVPLVCGPRQLVWVLLEHRRTGQLVTFHNRHYVPGAWSDSWKVNAKGRRAAWEAGWVRDQAYMQKLAAGAVTQAGGGDYNRPFMTWPRTMSQQAVRWFGHGYDHLVTVTGKASWHWNGARDLPAASGMDHRPVRAFLELNP